MNKKCAIDDCPNPARLSATGRPGKYCSDPCKQKAHRLRQRSVTKLDHESVTKLSSMLCSDTTNIGQENYQTLALSPHVYTAPTCDRTISQELYNSISIKDRQEVKPSGHPFTALGEDMTAVEQPPTAIRSPFRWVGGKSRLKKKIIELLSPHECYVEVFGGAAWVLLAKSPSRVEIFNDLDGEVVNFFRVIKERPEAFIESFEWDLVSRSVFHDLENQPPDQLSDVQRAHRFYYLIMAAWGAELASPRFQTSISDEGHGNRLIGALKTLRDRIMPVYQRLQTVIIENLDWRTCLARYDRDYAEKRVVMYLDPPYPQNNCNYQYNMRKWKEHEELARALRNLRSRFLLTSYNLPEIRALYDGFYITEVNFAAGMPVGERQRSRNDEIIVTNYDPALLGQK